MAHNTRQFTFEEIVDLRYQPGAVCTDVDSSWRHGTYETFVAPHEGKFWEFTVRVHTTEGWQNEEPFDAVEVEPVQTIVTVWNAVNYD